MLNWKYLDIFMDIKLRKIKKTDWLQMKKLWQEFEKYNLGILKQTDPSFTVFETKFTKEYFEKTLKQKNKLYLVATIDNKIVGFVLARVRKMSFGSGHNILHGSISEIFVSKRYRGKGIAELMWQEAVNFLKNKKVKFLQLHVFYENKMPQEIYKKWGFKPFGLIMKRKI